MDYLKTLPHKIHLNVHMVMPTSYINLNMHVDIYGLSKDSITHNDLNEHKVPKVP